HFGYCVPLPNDTCCVAGFPVMSLKGRTPTDGVQVQVFCAWAGAARNSSPATPRTAAPNANRRRRARSSKPSARASTLTSPPALSQPLELVAGTTTAIDAGMSATPFDGVVTAATKV